LRPGDDVRLALTTRRRYRVNAQAMETGEA
jgi:hypothetical protein